LTVSINTHLLYTCNSAGYVRFLTHFLRFHDHARALHQGVETASSNLISRCSRLAITATPQQQAAARAAADNVAAAMAALRDAARLRQGPQAVTAAGLSGGAGHISAAKAIQLSSRPASRFKA
jgi:hypothetical protein